MTTIGIQSLKRNKIWFQTVLTFYFILFLFRFPLPNAGEPFLNWKLYDHHWQQKRWIFTICFWLLGAYTGGNWYSVGSNKPRGAKVYSPLEILVFSEHLIGLVNIFFSWSVWVLWGFWEESRKFRGSRGGGREKAMWRAFWCSWGARAAAGGLCWV